MKSVRNFALVITAVACGLVCSSLLRAQNTASAPKGKVEIITVHGKSLEGNLEGDSPDRQVFVYLPPSYAGATNRRYPVVYLLHGYGLTGERWMRFANIASAADKDTATGSREMILVSPDAYTLYNGSMYSNSATTGDWETYIAEDLVGYIDGHYRSIADRMSRGLAGHSMGGYGTMRVGMKRPDVFGDLYAMSSCCLGANLTPSSQQMAVFDALKSPAEAKAGAQSKDIFALASLASAAAWSPNPKNPPFYFDAPMKGGIVQPDVVAKWAANAPLAMIDQYIPQLKKYHAIALEVGLQDTLLNSNRALDTLLTQSGVPHTFETYEGDHTNRVPERFEQQVIPFFSKNLRFK